MVLGRYFFFPNGLQVGCWKKNEINIISYYVHGPGAKGGRWQWWPLMLQCISELWDHSVSKTSKTTTCFTPVF